MSNKAIIERTVEALESRGFSNSEAVQMVSRIQSGSDEIVVATKSQTPDDFQAIITKAYDTGFKDGVNHERQSNYRYSSILAQRQQDPCSAQQGSFESTAAYGGGLYSTLFGGR